MTPASTTAATVSRVPTGALSRRARSLPTTFGMFSFLVTSTTTAMSTFPTGEALRARTALTMRILSTGLVTPSTAAMVSAVPTELCSPHTGGSNYIWNGWPNGDANYFYNVVSNSYGKFTLRTRETITVRVS